MDVTLRHRTASGGSLTNVWELDADGSVLACIQVGAAQPVVVAIRVASVRARRRERDEFAISQVGEEQFRIEHGTYDAHLPAPHPLLPDVALVLTHAPASAAARLSRIVNAG